MLYVSMIVVLNTNMEKLLFCQRKREPNKGLFDFVGGKAKPDEDGLICAYRELLEETGITVDNIKLYQIIDFVYHVSHITLRIYLGKLNDEISLTEEVNPLLWMDFNRDFNDKELFAAHVSHVIDLVKEIKLNPHTRRKYKL